MTDLRGALAHRLLMAFGEARTLAVITESLDVTAVWEHIADECIRQMQWARAETWTGTGPGVDAYDVTTLAPDDWKPEDSR